jgi:hypothetical protein
MKELNKRGGDVMMQYRKDIERSPTVDRAIECVRKTYPH